MDNCSGETQWREPRWILGVAVLFAAMAILASLLLKHYDLGTTARLAVALMPVPPFIYLFVAIIQGVRRQDEMMQRISLEALAFCCTGTALVTVTYGYLQKAGFFPLGNWAMVWPVMAFLYAVGFLVARARYR
jgi:hypothetical protein